jgi:hypothetical protein
VEHRAAEHGAGVAAGTRLPTQNKKEQCYMRLFKLIGALAVVLAFSALAVATASAAETLWKWLPGSVGETLKGKSAKATLTSTDPGVGTLTITCAKSSLLLSAKEEEKEVKSELVEKGSTEKKDATLSLLVVVFEECTALGLPVNSVGAPAKTILVHIEEHNCMISVPEKKFGVLLEILPLSLEVPAIKAGILVRGAVIGQLLGAKEGEKVLTYKLDLNAPGGTSQEIKKCEGGVENKLEAALDATGKFEPAFEEAKEGVLEFDMTKDTAGEEMMEK